MKTLFLSVSIIGLLSITTAYAICNPPSILKCECAHPIIENGILTCGPTYCSTGTTCMPLGNCCETEKLCGSLSTECCSDNEVCVNKTTCCPTEKPYIDANNNCVQCTSDTHCSDGKTCDTTTGICIQPTGGELYCKKLLDECKSWCEGNYKGDSLETGEEVGCVSCYLSSYNGPYQTETWECESGIQYQCWVEYNKADGDYGYYDLVNTTTFICYP